MTITTRGLRKIAVDGHSYVWRARKTKCPCCRSRAVVMDASRRGSVIHLPGPDALGAAQVVISPALIVARIREARTLGWKPGEGSGVFVVLGAAGT